MPSLRITGFQVYQIRFFQFPFPNPLLTERMVVLRWTGEDGDLWGWKGGRRLGAGDSSLQRASARSSCGC